MDGPELFAAYAYPPNELGYCGPDDPAGLLVRGTAEAAAEIGRHARAFDGAWIYLELIAAASGIADPLDRRVVEAYWVGNTLLDAIEPTWFVEALNARLAGQLTGQWAGGIPASALWSLPHHAFHVFAVYPWVGLLDRGGDTARSILDQCRVKVGVVESVSGAAALVRVPLLTWDGTELATNAETVIDARWQADGRSFLDGVDVGDTVSVHWDWICDILDADQATAIASYEARQLAATNASLEQC